MTKCSITLILLLSLSLALMSGSMRAQETNSGAIEGTVTNEMGKPVFKSKVHAERISSQPQSALYRFEETDENGHFSIDKLEWGGYVVGAMKKEDGYAYQLNRLCVPSIGTLPHATLTPKQSVATVRIQFAWKAAVLSGRVTDATTETPLQAHLYRSVRGGPQSVVLRRSI